MAGVAGIEPANADTKNRCLTTWPHPSITLYVARKALLSSLFALGKGVIAQNPNNLAIVIKCARTSHADHWLCRSEY